MNSSNRYLSDKNSLDRLISSKNGTCVRFNIPMYQRLYVWGEEQVKTLMKDILDAYERNEDIFIGTVVLKEQAEPDMDDCISYDLVDGQQRFTTLWLLSLLFNDNSLGNFTAIDQNNKEHLRLTFSIREEVSSFFKSLRKDTRSANESNSIDEKLRFIKEHIVTTEPNERVDFDSKTFKDKRVDKIRNGLKTISQVLLETINEYGESTLKGFSEFVFKKVQFITIRVPEVNDLNKLFEVLNNRGVQLLQEDVVKAKLMEKIKDEERSLYNILWSACSVMDDYVENNLKGSLISKNVKQTLNEIYSSNGEIDVRALKPENVGDLDINPMDLKQILKNESTEFQSGKTGETGGDKNGEGSSSDSEVQSVLSFPQLLLHTLRIYDLKYHRNELSVENGDNDLYPGIDERKLIEIFQHRLDKKENTPFDSEKFIQLLFNVRFTFDNAVVKWVEKGSERQLILQKIDERSDEYLSRTEAESELSDRLELLQRMLYHTQDPRKHNWLTPYLFYSLAGTKGDIYFKVGNYRECYTTLEKIDNLMFCSNLQGDRKEQTKLLCLGELDDLIKEYDFTKYEEIMELGLDTPHYWFYKIDLLLFNQRESDIYKNRIGNWGTFKMSSRNSIEHVFPQKSKGAIELNDEKENTIKKSIGNLALVSTVDNATYNNNYFSEKKNKYKDINGKVPPSLKHDWIYGYGDSWDIDEIKEHAKEVKELLEDYFDNFRSREDGYHIL